MHQYFDLVSRAGLFTLNALGEAEKRIREDASGTTIMVKNLQAWRSAQSTLRSYSFTIRAQRRSPS